LIWFTITCRARWALVLGGDLQKQRCAASIALLDEGSIQNAHRGKHFELGENVSGKSDRTSVWSEESTRRSCVELIPDGIS